MHRPQLFGSEIWDKIYLDFSLCKNTSTEFHRLYGGLNNSWESDQVISQQNLINVSSSCGCKLKYLWLKFYTILIYISSRPVASIRQSSYCQDHSRTLAYVLLFMLLQFCLIVGYYKDFLVILIWWPEYYCFWFIYLIALIGDKER